jgi:hypothetical protein
LTAKSPTSLICDRCAEPTINSPDTICGFCRSELIESLGASTSERVHAIWALGEAGHSKDSIATAVAEVARKEPVGEILVQLLAGAERVGVVA